MNQAAEYLKGSLCPFTWEPFKAELLRAKHTASLVKTQVLDVVQDPPDWRKVRGRCGIGLSVSRRAGGRQEAITQVLTAQRP